MLTKSDFPFIWLFIEKGQNAAVDLIVFHRVCMVSKGASRRTINPLYVREALADILGSRICRPCCYRSA
jgi:hypothetical protein